jgi:hypothetical protein
MMTTDTQLRLKEIKQSFRLMMDGATAQSMRNKGLDYHLNWGASQAMLRDKADEIGEDHDLAIALWKEDVRECKILATMVMPADTMEEDLVDLWMEQLRSQEIAELVSFNLWQYLPFAPVKAYEWIASDEPLRQLCGFHVLSRLFMNGQEPNERGINEYLDQMVTAVQGPSLAVRKAAYASAQHFAALGLVYQRLVDSAMRTIER